MLILAAALLVALGVVVWPPRARPPWLVGGGPVRSGLMGEPAARAGALGGAGRRPRWQTRRGGARDTEDLLVMLDAIAPALAAGLPPAAALGHLTWRGGSGDGSSEHRAGPVDALLDDLVAEAAAGRPLAPVWRHHGQGGRGAGRPATGSPGRLRVPGRWAPPGTAPAGWSREVAFVARAWALSESLGSPLAECATVAARAVRQQSARRQRLEIALAGPRATAAVLTALPLAGPLVGLLLGLSPGQLYAAPAAILSTAVGLALLLLGRWWCARLVAGITRLRPAGRGPRFSPPGRAAGWTR